MGYLHYSSHYLEKVCLDSVCESIAVYSVTLEAFATAEACEVILAVITGWNWVKLADEVVEDLRLQLDAVYFLD
jgi:hypothetical protein